MDQHPATPDKLWDTIWPDFIRHFKSNTTKASYQADLKEFIGIAGKDFLEIKETDVRCYYQTMQSKVSSGNIRPATMTKKFRELHSLSLFLCGKRENYQLPVTYQDYFYPYLTYLEKQEKFAKTVPLEHIDRLLKAAEEDKMAYCIIVLLHRAGLSSTEIGALRPENFAAYDNGVYAEISGRGEFCFIPEDVFIVLEQYLTVRQPAEYLFYNRNGNRLNTMYISRMMKKYTQIAGLPSYSAESIRNTCGATLFAYGASPEQVASQMGISTMQIKRYNNKYYRDTLQREANHLVKIRVEPPGKEANP